MDEDLLLLAILIDEEVAAQQSTRRIWSHSISLRREFQGEFNTLFEDLRADRRRFWVYFRMTPECFDELLELIKCYITKQYTHFRRQIGPAERLAVAIRFLATGDTFKTVGHSYRMGFTTVGAIVSEVCSAIWIRLQPLFMPEPTKEMWEENITGFNTNWQFPNCLGCIDGKHVTVKSPNNSGSNYFCYLQKFSVVLMAIVDHDYKFIAIDVGGYGKNSDGGIFEQSIMGQKFINKTFELPQDRPLPNQDVTTPCVLLGDEAFPLKEYLMRPYSHRNSV